VVLGALRSPLLAQLGHQPLHLLLERLGVLFYGKKCKDLGVPPAMKVGATQDWIQGIKRHHTGRRMPPLVYGLVYKGLGVSVDYS